MVGFQPCITLGFLIFVNKALSNVKINDEYISEFSGNTERVKEVSVKFVSDAIMPKRRFVSKPRPNSPKHNTTNVTEREPGVK